MWTEQACSSFIHNCIITISQRSKIDSYIMSFANFCFLKNKEDLKYIYVSLHCNQLKHLILGVKRLCGNYSDKIFPNIALILIIVFKEKCPFLYPRSEVKNYQMQICSYTQTILLNRTFKVLVDLNGPNQNSNWT